MNISDLVLAYKFDHWVQTWQVGVSNRDFLSPTSTFSRHPQTPSSPRTPRMSPVCSPNLEGAPPTSCCTGLKILSYDHRLESLSHPTRAVRGQQADVSHHISRRTPRPSRLVPRGSFEVWDPLSPPQGRPLAFPQPEASTRVRRPCCSSFYAFTLDFPLRAHAAHRMPGTTTSHPHALCTKIFDGN